MGQIHPNRDYDSVAIRLFKADHRKLEMLFDAYDALLAPTQRRDLAGQISDLTRAHLEVKERLLYPFLLIRLDDIALINRAAAAHVVAHDILDHIDTAENVDEEFDEHVNSLRHATIRRIRMEEHDIYPRLGDFANGLDALALQMTSVREQVDARLAHSALHRAHTYAANVTVMPQRAGRVSKSVAAGRK